MTACSWPAVRRFVACLCGAAALAPLCGCGTQAVPPGGYAETQAKIQNAADELRAAGAVMEMKDFMGMAAWAVDLSGKKITPEIIDALRRLNGTGELNLSGSDITDEQIPALNRLHPLYVLNLSDTAVTDAGIEQLQLNTIAQLNVSDTKVTKAAADKLVKRYKEDPAVHPFFRNLKVTR